MWKYVKYISEGQVSIYIFGKYGVSFINLFDTLNLIEFISLKENQLQDLY